VAVKGHRLSCNEYDVNSGPFQITDPEVSESSDEEFTWYNHELNGETYFCLVNVSRRTLEPGEQAYYCYGDRSNRFLLMNYGFCFLGNRYDSYAVNVKLDIDLKDLFVPYMVDFSGSDYS
jgi:hypothetical protein